MTLACAETFYVLRFSRENFTQALQTGTLEEDGAESAFETITDINESVRTGHWVGDCFIYTTATNRLNYLVGDQTYTISHFDSPHYLLGYLPRDGRVYLADRDVLITSFAVSLSVVEYQTLVLRGDLDAANAMLPDIADDQKNKIARFLEGQGYKEEALEVATDPEHRFELALSLNHLAIALDLARTADAEHKWKTVGDAALTAWDVKLAEECFTAARDLGSLLLLFSSTGNAGGLRDLATQADAAAANNIAFSCLWQVGDVEGCIDLLVRTGRTAEALLFAQTYRPSRLVGLAPKLRGELEEKGRGKVARALGMPPGVEGEGVEADEEMFPEWETWLRMEGEGRPAVESLIDVGVDGEGKASGETNGVNGVDGVSGEGKAAGETAKLEARKELAKIEREAVEEGEVDREVDQEAEAEAEA